MRPRHPDWYYREYARVFARGSQYDDETRLVDKLARIRGKRVEEIGGGTGEHSRRLLRLGPLSLDVLDQDIESCWILSRLFSHDRTVRVVCADGFQATFIPCYDAVVAMYSIVLEGIETEEELLARLQAVTARLLPGGQFLFEAIDAEASSRVYEGGKPTSVVDRHGDSATITSDYGPSRLWIRYEGLLGGTSISYDVVLFSTTEQRLRNLVRDSRLGKCTVIPLDPNRRRLLVSVFLDRTHGSSAS